MNGAPLEKDLSLIHKSRRLVRHHVRTDPLEYNNESLYYHISQDYDKQYEEKWSHNKMHGEGTLIWKDNKLYEGYFVRDKVLESAVADHDRIRGDEKVDNAHQQLFQKVHHPKDGCYR